MAIGTLFALPGSAEDWLQFSFANADSHIKIAAAIQKKYGMLIPTYPLDPIPWEDFQRLIANPVWLYNHQNSHNAQDGILGIQGADYTTGDLSRRDELDNFIRLHGNEHLLAETMLGVT
jgi:hypothetical protein